MEKIGFGGSCHWCTEAVFQSLKGVQTVNQGWIASAEPNDTLSEAVVVTFDPKAIPLASLIEVHLHTHSATAKHSMREKYRSAVYCYSDAQQAYAAKCLQELQPQFSEPLVTQVLMFDLFKASPENYQNYYLSNPNKPFCVKIIHPKLAKLRQRFGKNMKDEF